MFDSLPSFLGPLLGLLLVFGLPVAFCIAGYIAGRNQRIRGASSRRLGLIGLAVSGVACVVGILVPLAAIGGRSEQANTAVVVPGAALGAALAVAGAALGAAGVGQRRATWAGVIAIVLAFAAWL